MHSPNNETINITEVVFGDMSLLSSPLFLNVILNKISKNIYLYLQCMGNEKIYNL